MGSFKLIRAVRGGGSTFTSNGFSIAYPLPGLVIIISPTSNSKIALTSGISPPSSFDSSGKETVILIFSSRLYPFPGDVSRILSIRPSFTPSLNKDALAVAALAVGDPKSSAMGGLMTTVGGLVYPNPRFDISTLSTFPLGRNTALPVAALIPSTYPPGGGNVTTGSPYSGAYPPPGFSITTFLTIPLSMAASNAVISSTGW
mmetsp:Transcript_19781/g.29113  ORF Transcript_19781/g.29113 Transcript_19781/m.29113 type:complete len:202 (-) Transcript_19781:1260-1865(-)